MRDYTDYLQWVSANYLSSLCSLSICSGAFDSGRPSDPLYNFKRPSIPIQVLWKYAEHFAFGHRSLEASVT